MSTQFLLIITLLVIPNWLSAQLKAINDHRPQSFSSAEKKIMVSDYIQVGHQARNRFWKKYDKYEIEQKEVVIKIKELLTAYTKFHKKLTEQQIDNIVNATITQKNIIDQLISKYYRQIRKISDTETATQFYLIERYCHDLSHFSIMQYMFFDELAN